MSEPKSTKRPVEVIKMTHHHCCQYPWVEMCMGGVLGDISHSGVNNVSPNLELLLLHFWKIHPKYPKYGNLIKKNLEKFHLSTNFCQIWGLNPFPNIIRTLCLQEVKINLVQIKKLFGRKKLTLFLRDTLAWHRGSERSRQYIERTENIKIH